MNSDRQQVSPFLFLGVGNAQRGDDGAGPLLAERLAQRKSLRAQGVEVQPHSGEGASLIHLWEGRQGVVIADCMKTGRPLGDVQKFDATVHKLHGGVFRYSSHLFGLAEAVEMARQLGKLPPFLTIYGIEGGVFSFGASPSPEVAEALLVVERAIVALFKRLSSAAR